jgi:hypothetical protein
MDGNSHVQSIRLIIEWIQVHVEMWLELFFKIFFIKKYIRITFFLKKLFLILAHQNNFKILKKY